MQVRSRVARAVDTLIIADLGGAVVGLVGSLLGAQWALHAERDATLVRLFGAQAVVALVIALPRAFAVYRFTALLSPGSATLRRIARADALLVVAACAASLVVVLAGAETDVVSYALAAIQLVAWPGHLLLALVARALFLDADRPSLAAFARNYGVADLVLQRAVAIAAGATASGSPAGFALSWGPALALTVVRIGLLLKLRSSQARTQVAEVTAAHFD